MSSPILFAHSIISIGCLQKINKGASYSSPLTLVVTKTFLLDLSPLNNYVLVICLSEKNCVIFIFLCLSHLLFKN